MKTSFYSLFDEVINELLKKKKQIEIEKGQQCN